MPFQDADSRTAHVAVENALGVGITMYSTMLFHVWPEAPGGALSEFFLLGTIEPGGTALANHPANSGPGGYDYWTLLFSTDPTPDEIFATPPTISQLTAKGNGLTFTFIVEAEGECTILNPGAPDVTARWSALGSSSSYAFLSRGDYAGNLRAFTAASPTRVRLMAQA